MNKERFLIIDDDPSIGQMLENIIEDYDLGQVVDNFLNGESGLDAIPKFKPDIVFIDLLLPDVDGIEIVKNIKKQHHDIDFIMISQVSDRGMITEAYESGIEFYINKPINVIEVLSVTRRVIDSQRNRRMLEQIGHTLNRNQQPFQTNKPATMEERINVIFAELGVLADKGCEDLLEMVAIIDNAHGDIPMSLLYQQISEKYQRMNTNKSSSSKAIEQRIRRTIQSALLNIANLGIEDFGNYKFDRYASLLFGFQEVRRAMDCIRHDQTIKATINTKQFVNGLITLMNK